MKLLLFCYLIMVNICMQATDFLISKDDKYYNPLATSFKWDVKFNKEIKTNEAISVEYNIFDTRTQAILVNKTVQVEAGKSEFSIYLFLTDLTNEIKDPLIRFDILPANTTSYSCNLPNCKYSNSILFTGTDKINGNKEEKIDLLNTKLLKSKSFSIEQNTFKYLYFSSSDENLENGTCNFQVMFSIKIKVENAIVIDPERTTTNKEMLKETLENYKKIQSKSLINNSK